MGTVQPQTELYRSIAARVPLFGEQVTIDDRTFTADELFVLSSGTSNKYELQKGILTIMSPAGSEHGALAMKLGARLSVYAEDKDLGVVVAAETGFRLASNPDTVLAPDAAFVAKDRIAQQGLPATFFPGAPDLLVEVISPGDRTSEVAQKVGLWLEHGAQLIWVIDSRSKQVTIYRADGSTNIVDRFGVLDGERILPGFQYEVERLFA